MMKDLFINIYYSIHSLFKKPKIVEALYEGDEMSIKYSNGEIEKYIGSCTVWHKLPMMRRCSIEEESMLCDIWNYIKQHGNPYPEAHIKN